MVDAQCETCTVFRSAIVSLQEHGDALAAGEVPRVHCKRCNAELRLDASNRTLAFLRTQLAPPSTSRPIHPSPASVSGTVPSLDVPVSLAGVSVSGPPAATTVNGAGQEMAAQKPRRGLTFAVAALGVAVVGLGVIQLTRPTAAPASEAPPAAVPVVVSATPSAEPAPSASPSSWMQSVELPPAWVERPFVIEGSDVFIVGKGELSATPEKAMELARNDAIVRMVKQIQQELAGSPTGEFLQSRARDERTNASGEAIASRYLKQHGTTASPERVDAALRRRESGVEGFGRYRVTKDVYQQVVAGYRETSSLQGMVVGRFFPLLETTMHTEGDLVVLSVLRGRPAAEQGVRPGDVVLSVGGRPVATPDALNKTSADEWASTPVRGSLAVEVESTGAKRTLRFFKPAPPGP